MAERNKHAQEKFRLDHEMGPNQEVAHKLGVRAIQVAENHTVGPKATADQVLLNSQENLRAVSRDTNIGTHAAADRKMVQAMDDQKSYHVNQKEAAHIRDEIRAISSLDTGAADKVREAAHLAKDSQGHLITNNRKK